MTSTPQVVRIAPDWLPNTNHAGFYVAQALGYDLEEHLRFELLPFDGEAMPNRKIAAGETEFGLMPHQSIISMRARGVDVVSVAALAQPNTTTLAVRADSGVERPAQLAGKRYASFGTDFEALMVAEVIRADGGAEGPVVVAAEKLDIQQALLDGVIDVAWGFYAWEGIQAELAGVELRHFFVAEHGLPAEYFPLLFTTRTLIERQPELVAATVRVAARGYGYAAEHPDEAAEIFLQLARRHELPTQAGELARRSMRWLAPRYAGTLAGAPAGHPWGWHDAARWSAFAALVRRLAASAASAGTVGGPALEADAETAGYTNAFIHG